MKALSAPQRIVEPSVRRRGARAVAAAAVAGSVVSLISVAATAQAPSEIPQITYGERQAITVGVGQSVLVEAPWPAARVSVIQPEVADVQILTPRQVLVVGNKVGVTDLVLFNGGNQVWHARVSVIVDLTYLRGELARIFPGSDLDVVQSQDVLVVSGQLRRVEEASQLESFLDAYEVKYVDATSVAGVHQVMLQVRLAEVSRQAIRALGVNGIIGGSDVFGALQLGSDSGGPASPSPILPMEGASAAGNIPFLFSTAAVGSGVTLIGGVPSADLIVYLEALAENQYVRVLAEPTLIALSGEEASFLAGGEFPIPIVQGTGGGTSISIEYKEFGVRLEFRPFVLGDGTIRLRVAPEVSELSDFGAVIIEGFSIPSVLTRRADTTLEFGKSGQSFAMAGLLKQLTVARRSQIPLLGDLPVIGPLFRSVRYVSGETELVVMVTASLVEPLAGFEGQLLPGELHQPPSDWELLGEGRLEAGVPSAMAPADAAWLKKMGLDRLQGPGAWVEYGQLPVGGGTSDGGGP